MYYNERIKFVETISKVRCDVTCHFENGAKSEWSTCLNSKFSVKVHTNIKMSAADTVAQTAESKEVYVLQGASSCHINYSLFFNW